MKRHFRLMRKHEMHEHLIYLGLWLILFLSPVFSQYVRTVSDDTLAFQWSEVLCVWRMFLVYLAIFLIHNFFVAPLLVYKKRKMLYLATVFCLLAAFQVYQCTQRPADLGHYMGGEGPMGGPPALHDKRPPLGEEGSDVVPPPFDDEDRPGPDGGKPAPFADQKPPIFMGEHDVIAFIVIFLMLGMNVGVKLYFKSNHDSKKMEEQKSRNLEQQLEYLKYQINPHFFMNTLNNIHALVDIDPEKAKEMILELSKLMRYVLYEGAKATVPLQREAAFLNNYVTLMKIRYTDKVRITVDIPASLPDKSVPPLLFITFVENAFKHGVSYQRDSFIDVKMLVDKDRVKFICRNSKIDEQEEQHGGVGLANVRQRLGLLYGDDFTLDITDETDTYDVRLEVPLV